MRIDKVLLIIAVFGLNQNLFAAAPVFGSAKEDNYARSLKPPKGKSLIYIYQRPQQGGETSPLITLNKYKIGRIVPGSFTVWQLAPGRLELMVAGSEPANMVLQSSAGKIYLFRLNVTRSASGTRAVLESMPESYRGELAACRLLKNPRSISEQENAPLPQTQAKAPATSESNPPPVRREEKVRHTPGSRSPTVGGLSMQIKTGSLSLASKMQTILSQDRLFDDSTSGLLGIAIDYQSKNGLSLGGEVLNYKAHFVTSGTNNPGDVNTYVLLANAKQNFFTSSNFQPYLGVGFGIAVTSLSGALNGNTEGYAYQFLAGMEYRYANLGFFAEAKYLGASTQDSSNQKVDVSGSGIFAGVSFHY